jgi:DNA-binding beta-propeller fold protein YncE
MKISTQYCFFLTAILVAAMTPLYAKRANAELIYPNGLAIDATGNLYISDIGSHSILKLDKDARLTVIAGTGESGYNGDGGPAINARLNAPHDLAFDAQGRLLIADTYNHRIRRIDRQGIITTVAGDGLAPNLGYGQPPPKDSLNNPQGIAVDQAGNILIADTFNRVLRKVDARGVMTIIAGSVAGLNGDGGAATLALLNLPMAVAPAPDGTILISDAGNSRLRQIGVDGIMRTLSGFGGGDGLGGAGFAGDNGPAEKAKLFSPADVKVDRAGKIYISDSGNHRIRAITAGKVTTIAGSGRMGFGGDGKGATSAEINTPQKIAIDKNGNLFIADRANHRVRKVDARGIITTVAGGGRPSEMIFDPGR